MENLYEEYSSFDEEFIPRRDLDINSLCGDRKAVIFL